MKSSVIESVPDKMDGEPVFVGTRVPVSLFFAVLAEGHDYKYFLRGYPTVTKEQIFTLLEDAEKGLFCETTLIDEVIQMQEVMRAQQKGLGEILALMLCLMPDEKGERLTINAARQYVRLALKTGETN